MTYIFVKDAKTPKEWFVERTYQEVADRTDLFTFGANCPEDCDENEKHMGCTMYHWNDYTHEGEWDESVWNGGRIYGPEIVGSGATVSDMLKDVKEAVQATVNTIINTTNDTESQWLLVYRMCELIIKLEKYHPEAEVFIEGEDIDDPLDISTN